MVVYKLILLGLDFMDMDQVMLCYVWFLCEVFLGVEQICFQYNICFDYFEEVEFFLEELECLFLEFIGEEIEENIDIYFLQQNSGKMLDVDWEVMVIEGSFIVQEIVKIVNVQGVELIVVGKKLFYQGFGQVAEKVFRQVFLKLDLLVVLEMVLYYMECIFVLIDFFQVFRWVLLVGKWIKDLVEGVLMSQYVYIILMYYFFFILVQGFWKFMKEEVEDQYKCFWWGLLELLQDIFCVFMYSEDCIMVQVVYDFVI